jgi:hypothetical protein
MIQFVIVFFYANIFVISCKSMGVQSNKVNHHFNII